LHYRKTSIIRGGKRAAHSATVETRGIIPGHFNEGEASGLAQKRKKSRAGNENESCAERTSSWEKRSKHDFRTAFGEKEKTLLARIVPRGRSHPGRIG